MLLLVLVTVLLHLLEARDVPKDNSFVIKHVSSCPDVGYFFRREAVPNSLGPEVCHLCFCQHDGTAICWRRENRRCDAGSYQHHVEKRDIRVRRSPGLSDIFFRDAARDVFNKNTPPACKPYESSFSEGCPPVDWCIGCTVCDCDAHGRWDCHILSFCPDKVDKTKMRTAKKSLKKPKSKSAKTSRTTKKPVTTKAVTKPVTRRPSRKAKRARRGKIKSFNTTNKGSPKPLIINKDLSTKKPIVVKTGTNKIKLNVTEREAITKEVVKRVVSVMQRMLNKSQMLNNQLIKALPTPKTVQKRSSIDNKRRKKNVKKFKSATTHKKQYKKPVSGMNNNKLKRHNLNMYNNGWPDELTNSRRKREVEVTVVGINNLNNNNRSNNTLSNLDTSVDKEIFRKETTAEKYYKYSIFSNNPGNGSHNKESIQIIYVDGVKNLSDSKSQSVLKTEPVKITYDLKSNSTKSNSKTMEGNKIPLGSSPSINVSKTENTMQVDVLNKNISTNTSTSYAALEPYIISNVTTLHDETATTKHYFKNIERVLKFYFTKYNKSGIHNNQSSDKINNLKKNNEESSFTTQVVKKIVNIQNVFKSLLNDIRKNHTRIDKPKVKKFNAINCLKRFFKKFFLKNNKKTKTDHVIDSICEIFGSCNKNKRNSKILKSKVKALDVEANMILRTIKTIKGLLHLLDFNNKTKVENSTLEDDIHKLNFVFRENDVKMEQKVTENQKALINYIKSNSQVFIQAVGRFSKVLSDIIEVLVNKSKNHVGDIRNRRNIQKTVVPQNNDYNFTATKDFSRLKSLLLKYNLLQNTFMTKIYKMLKKLRNSEKEVSDKNVSKPNEKSYNTTGTIKYISRNIIQNLRKLKNLAEVLNSKNRRKRSVMRDDTMDYLLTLMEYLLKQNSLLNDTPVNDGIDLLIEAIKSAPDIKLIKRKVLNTSQNRNVSRTTEVLPQKISYEDSLLNSNTNSSKEDNATSSRYTFKPETEELPADPFRRRSRYQQVNNILKETSESVTTVSTIHQFLNDIVVTTTPYPIANNNEEDDQTEISHIDLNENENKDKKIEIFSDTDDEDSIIETTSTSTVTDAEYTKVTLPTEIPIVTTESKMADVKPNDLNYGSDGVQHITLDWLDKGYDQNGKYKKKRKSENITTNQLTKILTTTTKTILQRNIDTISGITKESSDEEDKKESGKTNVEEIMYKKKMDLLNSLDYGTEGYELDVSETKQDREDAFISYYT